MRAGVAAAVVVTMALGGVALAQHRPVPRPETAPEVTTPDATATERDNTPAPPEKPDAAAPPMAVETIAEPSPAPPPKPAAPPTMPETTADAPPVAVITDPAPPTDLPPQIIAPPQVAGPPRITVPLSPLNPSGILTAPPPVGAAPMPLPQGGDCLAALEALGVTFTRPGPITGEAPGCGIPDPVQVDQIAPGIALHGTAPMRCETALALAQWTRGFVQPAAAIWAAQGHGALTGYRTGSTYACRARNGDGSGKVSEHAIGNAIDIAAFTFQDSPDLPIAPRASGNDLETAFQRTVSGAGCLFFTTVLGPGSDGAHEDHLHLDIKPRNGGYRICQ